MSILFTRRSVRTYKKEQITAKELDYVLNAGLYAPSGRNLQTSIMVAIQSPELIAKLSKLNADVMGTDGDPFYGAPTVVIVFADSTVRTHFEDGCLTLGNMMNAAAEIGLGSCWIHRAREVFAEGEGKALKKEWGVPENYIGIGNCILGYSAAELPLASERKPNRIIKIQ